MESSALIHPLVKFWLDGITPFSLNMDESSSTNSKHVFTILVSSYNAIWKRTALIKISNVGLKSRQPSTNQRAVKLFSLKKEEVVYTNRPKIVEQHAKCKHAINHSRHFVDPITGAHIQGIESAWNRIKTQMKKSKGCRRAHLQSYLNEHMWFDGRTELEMRLDTTPNGNTSRSPPALPRNNNNT